MYRERPSAVIPGAIVWQRTGAGVHRVLPDGCTDFLWDGASVRIAGPDTAAFLAASAGHTITGLRFAPGWGPSVFGVPADCFLNQRVPLDAVWSTRAARDAEERLAAGARPGAALEAIAAERLAHVGASHEMLDAIVAALRCGHRVRAVASHIGFSERQLQRRSVAAFGYGPKMLARILRLERAIALAHAGLDLGAVAAHAGYADQSHLANDAQALTGVTMTTLLVA